MTSSSLTSITSAATSTTGAATSAGGFDFDFLAFDALGIGDLGVEVS
jgi:hypothetical protein